MEYLIKLITQPNGVVLDPFMGSGTTGIAAKKNGFRFIGMEMQTEYMAIAENRIKGAV
jgi:site-specific DNA-methyltransferase (adenine-specific)